MRTTYIFFSHILSFFSLTKPPKKTPAVDEIASGDGNEETISPELKKTRETNSKLQYQLGILERSIAKETGGAAAAPAKPKKVRKRNCT